MQINTKKLKELLKNSALDLALSSEMVSTRYAIGMIDNYQVQIFVTRDPVDMFSGPTMDVNFCIDAGPSTLGEKLKTKRLKKAKK